MTVMRLDKLIETMGYSDDELDIQTAQRFYLEGATDEESYE